MKTQNSKTALDFRKNSIAELNDNQLMEINGGTSTLCVVVGTIFLAGVIKGATDEITN